MSTETSPPPGGKRLIGHDRRDYQPATAVSHTVPARKLPSWRSARRANLEGPFHAVMSLGPDAPVTTPITGDKWRDWHYRNAAQEAITLPRADLFYATPEMCRLLAGAFESLDLATVDTLPTPPKVPGTDGDLQSIDGLIYLAEPISLGDVERSIPMEAGGLMARWLMWSLVTPDEDTAHVIFWCHGWVEDKETVARDMVTAKGDSGKLSWSNRAKDDEHDAARLVLTAWLLMSQENLTEQATRDPSPARQKARGRKKRDDATPVTVVDLRRASRARQAAVEGAAQSRFHSRWIVRGHWRNQACGKGQSERRPIYVEPYYKGPVDAPLVVRERVFQW